MLQPVVSPHSPSGLALNDTPVTGRTVLDASLVDPALADLFAHSLLAPLQLKGDTLLPVVQGGMGIGVSAHRLAGNVAACGGIGTLSSVDLRRHHPDLMEETTGLGAGQDAKDKINAANMVALEREIKLARALSGGRGKLAVNVMRAVAEYSPQITHALACGVDAVVVGAGLPLDLPDLAQDFPHALLIPILSDSRGINLVLKKWERKKRLPDAIVIEHPRLAGGHLGAAKIADLQDGRFEYERVIPESLALLRAMGIEREVPLIVAGGIRSHADVAWLQSLGASAVQMGTPFAVTSEGDAHPEFKRVLAETEDTVEFVSVAGLPARAVATPWLKSYLKMEVKLQSVAHPKARCTKAFDCLEQCGLRDGHSTWGQFCIDSQLAAALRGDVNKGLFFRGAGPLPFGAEVRSVRDLLTHLFTPAQGWVLGEGLTRGLKPPVA